MWSSANYLYFLVAWLIVILVCGVFFILLKKTKKFSKPLLISIIAILVLFDVFKYIGEFAGSLSMDLPKSNIYLPLTICFAYTIIIAIFALTKLNTSLNRNCFVIALVIGAGNSLLSLVAPDLAMDIPAQVGSILDLWGFIYHYLVVIITFMLFASKYYKVQFKDIGSTLPFVFIWLCVIALFTNIYRVNYDMFYLVKQWWFSIIAIFAYVAIYIGILSLIVCIENKTMKTIKK